MATKVEIEEIESTKSEKFLAVVLAAFLLVGGIWFYAKADNWVRDAVRESAPTVQEQRALDTLDTAHARLATAEEDRFVARDELDLAREAFRTALDAGQPSAALEREYERAQARFRAAQREERAAELAVQAAEPAADEAQAAIGERQAATEDRRAWLTALIRFVFIAAWLGGAVRLLGALRRRESRYLPLAFAVLGAGTVLVLVFASDYITDYVDPLDLGPLVLALVGALLTFAAFVALQRYLARRIPARRTRKGECPFCGYPVREGPHCEGCGRQVIGDCSTCGRPRRVGTARCASCGNP